MLADRIRLQKSTSGARPIAPAGEEPAETSVGLAAQCESIGQRRNAGSRISVAKSRDRWRALIPNTNGFRESGPRSRRALVDERRSGPWKPFSLTRGRGKRFWFSEKRPGSPGTRGARQGASEASVANPAHGRKSLSSGSIARSDARRSSEMNERCEQRSRSSVGAVKRASNRGCVGRKASVAPAQRRALRSTETWVAVARGAGQ